ncbi:abasic site processing protein HMCES-like [Haemaphysalis longicornis]
MCSRVACALNQPALLHACLYKDPNGVYRVPDWVDLNCHAEYKPSYNVSPRNYHPVLFSAVHVPKGLWPPRSSGGARKAPGTTHVMSPMRWGLVPSWYKQEPQNFIWNTVNCRIESCTDKISFRGAIKAERRCVVVAEGFFEWTTDDDGQRHAYYVYFKQPSNVSMEHRDWEQVHDPHRLMRNGRWAGPRLLTMAGIFDISTTNDDLYSFSILTMDAPEYLQWLQNRVPVILNGEEAVDRWLDPKYTFKELTRNVRSPSNLVCHRVSPIVTKVTISTVECVLPYGSAKKRRDESRGKTKAGKHRSRSPAKPAKRARRSAGSSRRSSTTRKQASSSHKRSSSSRKHAGSAHKSKKSSRRGRKR